MGKCKKDVTPLLTHWSYIFLALTHRYCTQTSLSVTPSMVLGLNCINLFNINMSCRIYCWSSITTMMINKDLFYLKSHWKLTAASNIFFFERLHFEWHYLINSLWPIDVIRQHRYGSTLTKVMACCLTALCHYENQCWLFTKFIDIHLQAISQGIHTSAMND